MLFENSFWELEGSKHSIAKESRMLFPFLMRKLQCFTSELLQNDTSESIKRFEFLKFFQVYEFCETFRGLG